MASRQEKNPNTKTFEFYNANPKGKYTSDCVVRAICTALDKPYEEVLMELTQMTCETGIFLNDKNGYGKYLEDKGWKKIKQPRKSNNKKYTGSEFCGIFKGVCVAHIGGHHIVCIKNGKVLDTWDSTEYTIGNYWVKE